MRFIASLVAAAAALAPLAFAQDVAINPVELAQVRYLTFLAPRMCAQIVLNSASTRPSPSPAGRVLTTLLVSLKNYSPTDLC